MTKDEHIERHLELCQQEHQRLVEGGKWPWTDSQNSEDLVDSTDQVPPLPDETIKALERFGRVLRTTYLRLHRDGYRLRDGKLIQIDK